MKVFDFLAVGKRAQHVYARFCQKVCQRYGVNQTGFDILMFLSNHTQFNTARDICLVRGIKSGMVSVSVENLIRAGYLERVEDPGDRRIHRLALTAAAEPLTAEGREIQRRFAEALSEGISAEERAAFRRTTEKLVENITALDKGANAE